MPNKYVMTISRLTIDKLGVKLYDRVSAVIAELIANSYDADATEVTIEAPMDQFLARKSDGAVKDRGLEISVKDDGIGMTPDEVKEYYLKVGAERRRETGRGRGGISPLHKRTVMGRKGVGKLAPFGICEEIEVLTSGGEYVSEATSEAGEPQSGYLTAHFILDRNKIVQDTDSDFEAEVGSEDGKYRPARGTIIKLRKFSYRRVNRHGEFTRQIAQRFGIRSHNWKILTRDISPQTADTGQDSTERIVGVLDVDTMENSKIEFNGPDGPTLIRADSSEFTTIMPTASSAQIKPGFELDKSFYPLKGWVAYAKKPYKDDLIAGVRIYCRGKIAAQTSVFNRGAGFLGEYTIRSYLVGELHADWLDEAEDLIQTDRRDILWSHEVGQRFESWGQSVIREIGKIARDPFRKSMVTRFFEVGHVEEQIQKAFPSRSHDEIRKRALSIAEVLGKSLRGDEVSDHDVVTAMIRLSVNLAPHITLQDELRTAADQESAIGMMGKILESARVAELSSFGRIAEDRLGVIRRLHELKDAEKSDEMDFQELLERAPWLINPEWSPVTQNQTFRTISKEFMKKIAKSGLDFGRWTGAKSRMRPDFVMLTQNGCVQIVEIKNRGHVLRNDEMDRIIQYRKIMLEVINEVSDPSGSSTYKDLHITIVCDGVALTGAQQIAFDTWKLNGELAHITWRAFLMRTTRVHEQFLEEAERQRELSDDDPSD